MVIKSLAELLEHRAKDWEKILNAVKIQDGLQRKVGGKSSEEIIREWRDRR